MSTVLTSHPADGVTQLTLNRPEKLNAMDVTLVTELHAALDAVAADPGYGEAPDSAGRGRVGAGFATQQHIAALVPRLRSLHQPVIAAVNGAAAGGGLALALASDVRIAATSAKFNVAFVRIGLSGCDIGVSWLLPRLIGASRAWELMLTGRVIDSAEADHIGLVTRVVPDGTVVESALETAELIARNSPWGVRMTKEVAWSQLEIGSLQAGIDLENRTQILSTMTGDMQEAIAAFLEKRPPTYTNS
jgi:enoyl-CoA hydratase